MAALAGIGRWYQHQMFASPEGLVVKLPAKLSPALVENGLVQTRLGSDIPAGSLKRPLGRPAHIGYPQIFQHHHFVILAYGGADLVQVVTSGVGYMGMDLADFVLLLVPVGGSLGLAGEFTLGFDKFCFELPKTVQRLEVAAVGKGGKTLYPHVDADGSLGRVYG